MALVVPQDILLQHIAVLGKTGSGKSSVMRYLVEHQLEHSKPVCIIDPKGDWHGLRSSANGKGAGYPVVIFGGDHADVPIDENAGTAVAELVATGNRPAIIDLGGWTVHARTRFFIAFAESFFRQSRGQRWLCIDEVHNVAPKGKIMSPEAGMMLHWANRLASEGRGKGINLIVASQRPQKVHNDLLTSCETLIAMRVIHPRDREAVAEWLEGAGDKEKANEVLATLAQMQRGEGWVWSPEIGFGPKRVAFPLFKTFDSFAANAGSSLQPLKGWASVDLDEVRQKLAATIAKAKADDPRELRRRIGELERQLRTAPKPAASPATITETKIVEKPVFRDGQVQRLEKLVERLTGVVETVRSSGEEIAAKLAVATRAAGAPLPVVHRPRTEAASMFRTIPATPRVARVAHVVTGNTGNASDAAVGGGGLRRMMIALAQRQGLSVKKMAVRSGMSSKSGTFGVYLGRMRANNWVAGSRDAMTLTPAGTAALGDFEPLPEGPELLEYWLRELGNSGAARILRAAAAVYPDALSKEQLAEASDMSGSSGTFGVYLGRLRALDLLEGRSEIRASDELF